MGEGPKKVTCCICAQEVTKRSTLEIAPGQRACRTHPEVAAFLEAQEARKKAAQDDARIREVGQQLQDLMLCSLVRVQSFRAGVSVGFGALGLLSHLPHKDYMRIREMVLKMGEMTEDEYMSSLLTALELQGNGFLGVSNGEI